MPRLYLTVLAAMLASSACQQSDEAVCLQRRQLARHAALDDRLTEASQLVDEVDATCGPNSQSAVRNIRKMIAEKQRKAAELRKAREAREEEQRRFPSRRFLAWATAQPSRATRDVEDETCAEPGEPDDGFCTAHAPGSGNMRLRYWKDRNDAYLYSLETTSPVSCRQLTEYRRVRSWQSGDRRYELCELTGRELRHLSALIETQGGKNRFLLFSQPYLAYDAELNRLLRGPN